jgi:hypothetical protein
MSAVPEVAPLRLDLKWRLFKRPIKPVSFALMITMILMGVFAICDYGVLGASDWSNFYGTATALVAGLFMYGWWASSQRIAEWALLGSFWAWSAFTLLVFFVGRDIDSTPFDDLGLAVAFTIIAGGSYVLEATDPRGHNKER